MVKKEKNKGIGLPAFTVNKIGIGVVIFLNILIFLCLSINNSLIEKTGSIALLILNLISIISLIGLKRK